MRTIADRRQEVGLRAPNPQQMSHVWKNRGATLSCFREKTHYEPYEPFREAHFSDASTVLVSGANRVGKSVASAMEAIAWVPFSRLIWFIGPSYAHTRKEFEYFVEAMLAAKLLKTDAFSLPQREHLAASAVTISGCVIQTKTLKDMVKSLQSESPDLMVFCEAGLVQENPLDRMRIRLSTSRGRLWISGTMEEAADWLRQAYDRWQDWPNDELARSYNIPLWYNTNDFPGGRDNPEISFMEKTLQSNLFIEKIEGRPAPSEHLVFGKHFRIGNTPFFARPCAFQRLTPDGVRWPVELAIDPGFNPSHYAVLFMQRHGDEWWVIDEVAVQGYPHEAVIGMCRNLPAWENVIGGVLDPHAARSHGLGYQFSPQEIWVTETHLPIRAEIRPSPQEIVERWNYYLVHPTNSECRIYFDPQRCPHLLYEMRHWRYHKDIAGRPIKTEPQKRNCDSIKAIGCFLVDKFSKEAWVRRFPSAPRGFAHTRFDSPPTTT